VPLVYIADPNQVPYQDEPPSYDAVVAHSEEGSLIGAHAHGEEDEVDVESGRLRYEWWKDRGIGFSLCFALVLFLFAIVFMSVAIIS
jgi:hypothetical protein